MLIKNHLWRGASLKLIISCCLALGETNVNANSTKFYTNTVSQQIIRGKVLDEKGKPLQDVSITNLQTNSTVKTDISGSYAINAQNGDKLEFSLMGYKNSTVDIGTKTNIDLVLEEDISALDEVVVVGMGTQKKASVIGAISSVKMDDLQVPSRSLTNALAGKMAGAVVVQRTGELGRDNGNIWIRGISTFSANRSPLILVDGVERDMNDIPVEEIESVSILKDASATAVYGVRAANGVVIVTTRRGKVQKPSIQLVAETGLSDLPTLPKFINGVDYAKLYNEALGRENYSLEYIENTKNGTDPYLYPNVNWYDELYKKHANNTNANLSIRGGGEVARYFTSFGYFNESGNFKDNPENDYKSNMKLNRFNFRSNVDISLTKSTEIGLEVNGSLTDLHTPGMGSTTWTSNYSIAQQLFYWASQATPIGNPVKLPIGEDINGNTIWGWGAPTQAGEYNPAERLLGSGYNTEFRNQFMSQVSLNQNLEKILPGLTFRFAFSFDAYSQTEIQRRKNSNTYGITGRDSNGDLIFKEVTLGQEFLNYSRSLLSNRAKELKTQFNYNKSFENHNVTAMIMYYQRDYINGNASSSILALPYRRQGIAFRTTYDYNNRYFTEFNLGYNGSENFPNENRFGWFPAVAAGIIPSNEVYWDDLRNTINLFKIRGSIGLVGSEALPGGNRYGYLSVFGNGLGSYPFGEVPVTYPGTGEDRIGVNNLTWEKGLKRNIGIELGFFNNLIKLEADYFHEKRTDILLQRASLPEYAGFSAAPFANMGRMINRGFDATIEFNKRTETLGIRTYGNFTFAKDKILEQDEAQKNFEYRMRTGHKFGQQFGLTSLGLFTNQDEITNSPSQTFGTVRPGDVKFFDQNGDGKITIDDEAPIGYSNIPEINYGFGFQLDYKGFDFGMFFRGQARVTYSLGGAYIPFNQGVGKGNIFSEGLNRWTEENPNPNALYPRIFNGTSANNWQASTRTIYDGSFLRLSEVEFGYSFSSKLLSKIKIQKLRLYVLGNNVALFSPWKLWDPETGSADGMNYPLQRKFNFGMRVSL